MTVQQTARPQVDDAPTFTVRGGVPQRASGVSQWLHVTAVLRVVLVLVVFTEMTLLLIDLVPQSIWTANGYPNGPIPRDLYPVVAGLFYALPALVGALCRRWPAAVVLATLPAWLDLGIFAVAAASRIGPFYLAQQNNAVSTVGTLELFAVLGALGWLARVAILAVLPRQRRGEYVG